MISGVPLAYASQTMHTQATVLSLVSALGLCACGGGGTNPGSGMRYAYVEPVLNQTHTYSEVVIDNANNTINLGFGVTTTAVSATGASQLSQSTTGDSTIVDGTNYAVLTENQSFNDMGQEKSYTYLGAGGSTVTCTFTPHGAGPDWPVQVGGTWQATYAFACDAGTPVTYGQTGTVVDVEAVTVPAGTFTALKLQSTVTWTDANGTMRTQTITNWRDIATSYSVKEEIAIAVSGTLPATGYAVSRTSVLESIS